MEKPPPAAPVQRDEHGHSRRLIQGFGWLLVLGLSATSAALWWAPPLTFSSNVVEGRVLNPETVVLPFGPNASFSMLRVHVFPQGKPVQLWNSSVPKEGLLLETKFGTVRVVPPRWEGWRRAPGARWSSDPWGRTFETLEGLPVVSEIPGWREADTSRGYRVDCRPLSKGDWVVIEDPHTKNARLWPGTMASIQTGHRFSARIAGGILLLVSTGLGWATVLFTRGTRTQRG